MLVQNSIERIKEFVQRLFSHVVEEGLGTAQIQRIQRKGRSAFRSVSIKKFQPDSKVVIINVHVFGYRVEIFFTRSNVGMTMDVAPVLTRAFEVEFPKKPAPMRKKRGQVLVGGPRIYFAGSKEQQGTGATRSVGSHWVDVRPAIQGEHGTSLVAFPLWNAQVPAPQKVEEVRPADQLPLSTAPVIVLEEQPLAPEVVESTAQSITEEAVEIGSAEVTVASEETEKSVCVVSLPKPGGVDDKRHLTAVIKLLRKKSDCVTRYAGYSGAIDKSVAREALMKRWAYTKLSSGRMLAALERRHLIEKCSKGICYYLRSKSIEEKMIHDLFK